MRKHTAEWKRTFETNKQKGGNIVYDIFDYWYNHCWRLKKEKVTFFIMILVDYKRFLFPKMLLGSTYSLTDFSIPKPTSEMLSFSHCFRNLPTGKTKQKCFNIRCGAGNQSIFVTTSEQTLCDKCFYSKMRNVLLIWFIEPTRLSSSLSPTHSQGKSVLRSVSSSR